MEINLQLICTYESYEKILKIIIKSFTDVY